MSTISTSIDVNVPASMAYNQWTQFETFPRFMEGVREVKQVDDRRLHWRAEVWGKEEEWDAEIMEQIPDKRIAWRSTTGAANAGIVTFHRLSNESSRVVVQMEYDPKGMIENVGDSLGLLAQRVEGDLARFKEFIEVRGHETGAWRGEIQDPRNRRPS